MSTISQRFEQIRARVHRTAEACGRKPEDIEIIAVSKTCPASSIEQAVAAGARHLGESYIQEAVEKIQQLSGLAAIWHFIGPIQSNKTRQIAEHFAWVHSVDREKIARRLNDQRPEHLPPLNIILQLNISQDPNKQGIAPAGLEQLAAQIVEMPRLKLRGIMAVPAIDLEESELRRQFRAMNTLLTGLQTKYPECNQLSLGMSGDMDIAIECGSTMVRVGSAIFGSRPGR
ncbi:YggS family pyridoxal phosphate-dependent enzyme [Gynuella sunshinyii]|uniref:Pyridoxal phosphate homeostasis protein n=1 Tax=Gynuella sunshinyii YC6258 TaxID=1445510 RepID=A0A0C5VEE7_9GAMM|nr:YggS family pyridoxal phosphate-dependent enzyme [Gynuella sunshinyii]AJQ92922.1 putative enzyme with a TIM-barrel fold [Gynuella sunshinyii YC6258]